jgi:hypothetical protein
MSFQRKWLLPALILLTTCFCVFVLPYLFPPAPVEGISEANVEGFNNRIAVVAAALLSLSVLAIQFVRKPTSQTLPPDLTDDKRPLPGWLVVAVVAFITVALGYFCFLVVRSRMRFTVDAFYLIQQIDMYSEFGRKLYDQIEFPYGPLLFYSPVVMQHLLSPLHASLTAAYFTTFVLAQAIGLLLGAWLVNSLPMLRRWRILFFVVLAICALQLGLGLNYSLLRFLVAPCCIVLLGRMRTQWQLALALAATQLLCLAVSPEMGFALFLAGSCFTCWKARPIGGEWNPRWLLCILALPCGIALFLCVVGSGYVLMLGLFSRGLMNFSVPPLLYIFFFLFCFIWVVPTDLAERIRSMDPNTPTMLGLYALSIALLPVAFGRADTGHVYFNELTLYALSYAALTSLAKRWQMVIAAFFAFVVLQPLIFLQRSTFTLQTQRVLRRWFYSPDTDAAGKAAGALFHRIASAASERQRNYDVQDNIPFDIDRLRQFTGDAPVATPREISLNLEEKLRAHGQFQPSFYCYDFGLIDRAGELRQLQEFNQSEWALIATGLVLVRNEANGGPNPPPFEMPFKLHRKPYPLGLIFQQNLEQNWQPVAEVSEYTLYKRR